MIHELCLDIEARLMGVLKQEYIPGDLLGLPNPTPPANFIVRLVVDALQVVTGNPGVHVVQLMSVHVQQDERREPAGKFQRPRENLLFVRGKRIDGFAMAQLHRNVCVLAEDDNVLHDQR